MFRGRDAQGMSVNIIIIAAIALIILVILVVLVLNASGGITTGTNQCEDGSIPGATCSFPGESCPTGYFPDFQRSASCNEFGDEDRTCCIPLGSQ